MSLRVVHTLEAVPALVNNNPPPEERPVAQAPAQGASVGLDASAGSPVAGDGGHSADHVVGMEHEEGRAVLEDLVARATTPDRVYRHQWSRATR